MFEVIAVFLTHDVTGCKTRVFSHVERTVMHDNGGGKVMELHIGDTDSVFIPMSSVLYIRVNLSKFKQEEI